MKNNNNLHTAKVKRNDEFYTQLSDIEKELRFYTPNFHDKIIYCNCDDYRQSNFWVYFYENFHYLKLKKLICTGFVAGGKGIVAEYDGTNLTTGYLEDDGDFMSKNCIEYLKEADIVVTNPPFSLFREYVKQLMDYNKKFIIIGNTNAATYKEIFPYIKNNQLWVGVTNYNVGMYFELPDDYEDYKYINSNGKKVGRVSTSCWWTNIVNKRRTDKIELWREYNPTDYPKYDNYDAIDVSKYEDIPMDYDGVMGVPVTFLGHYNPTQFQIIGCADADIVPNGWKGMSTDFVKLYYSQGNTGLYKEGNRLACFVDSNGKAKVPFKRLLIKRVS